MEAAFGENFCRHAAAGAGADNANVVLLWRTGHLSHAMLSPYRLFFLISETAKSRSEEHTSELQSRLHLVCRLLLEKKITRQTVPLPQNSVGLALPGIGLLGLECPPPAQQWATRGPLDNEQSKARRVSTAPVQQL